MSGKFTALASAALVLSLALVASSTSFAAEPTADELMAAAHAGRAEWKKFPGFQADVVASTSGKSVKGTMSVSATGELTLDVPDATHLPWLEKTLQSVIGHRLSDDGAIKDLEFADDDMQHPLGRLLKPKDAADKNRWRVKGDVMTEVQRSPGKSRFIISVVDVQRNAENKHLPRNFTITTWDQETNQIQSARQVYNEWKRVGTFDLPTRLLGTTAKSDGSRVVEEITITNHKLLSTTAVVGNVEELAALKTPVTSFGAAIVGDELYVYGGHTGTAHKYFAGLESKELQQLDLKSGKAWQVKSEGPGRTGLAMVSHGGKLYRIGGFYAKNADGEEWKLVSSADFASYDPQSGKWTDLSPMPRGRSSHDAVVLGDKIYVFGGWELKESNDGNWVTEGCVYDLATKQPKWETLPKAPFARRALSVAAFDNKLYVIGGMEDTGNVSTKVGIFDPATNKWSDGPTLPGSGMDGFGTSAFGTATGLYATTMPGYLFRLTKEGQEWELVGKLKHPRFFHRLVAKEDGTLVAVGGTSMKGRVPGVEVFKVDVKTESK